MNLPAIAQHSFVHPILPTAMKTLRTLVRPLMLAALGLLAAAAPLHAANSRPPEKMSYQSYLVDANGLPLGPSQTGPKNFDVIFRIFNDQVASAAGNRVWTEQQTITVDNGYFSVLLGEGNAYASEARPPLSSIFTNLVDASDRFIEMTVKGIGAGGVDATISPRVRLLPSAYAYLATTAINANNLVNSGNSTVVNVSGSNVGINQANPGAALDVNGSFKSTTATVSGAGSFGSLSAGSASVSGAVSAGSVSSSGTVSAPTVNVSGNVTASQFIGDGTIPVGGIILWSGNVASIPSGWALCNGTTSNGRATPDLRNRFVIGAGSDYSPGQTGGNASITLSVGQLPPHTHGYNDWYFSENHGSNQGYEGSKSGYDTDNAPWGRDRTTASTGSGQAIDIRPPYYALAYIMRVR